MQKNAARKCSLGKSTSKADDSPQPCANPLILTAKFDDKSQAVFQTLRDRHFPPALNIVPAHLTLFHKLPQGDLPAIETMLSSMVARKAPEAFTTQGLVPLGRGVAIKIVAPRLCAQQSQLAALWQAQLSAQDKQQFKAHVTVQNKVLPEQARATLDLLKDVAATGVVTGLSLWFYRQGPWQHHQDFLFDAALTPVRATGDAILN